MLSKIKHALYTALVISGLMSILGGIMLVNTLTYVM